MKSQDLFVVPCRQSLLAKPLDRNGRKWATEALARISRSIAADIEFLRMYPLDLARVQYLGRAQLASIFS